jgi:glycosyltransferase involved in cell wall biosynthesis
MPDIVHVSSALFGPDGYWGGGERFSLELARAQSRDASVRLVTFGETARRFRLEELEVHVLPVRTRVKGHCLNPISELLVPEIASAPIVHIHQYQTALTDIALLLGRAFRRKLFVTDLGGAAPSLRRWLTLDRFVSGHLALSEFAAGFYPQLQSRTTVIYGGADPKLFAPSTGGRENVIVFVGRLMPHKGIHDLIGAVDADMPLEIYGRPYEPAYRDALRDLALGKNVRFFEAATDEMVREAYQRARVVVLPSVHHSTYGGPAPKAELLGLTLIEAMACGTPVICSSAGAMPEVVTDRVSGYVYPAGDRGALSDRLRALWHDDRLWHSMSEAALQSYHGRFTWRHVAERCRSAYADEA